MFISCRMQFSYIYIRICIFNANIVETSHDNIMDFHLKIHDNMITKDALVCSQALLLDQNCLYRGLEFNGSS